MKFSTKIMSSTLFLSLLISTYTFGEESINEKQTPEYKLEQVLDYSAEEINNIIKDREVFNEIGIVYYDEIIS